MTQTPILEFDQGAFFRGPAASLQGPTGFMRLVLSQSYQHANLMTTATGASADTKHRWASRAAQIKALLDQLPAPENPRDPFDDIPGEPTPEEADAAWRQRIADEDKREAARRAPPGPTPKSTVPAPRYFYHPESDCLMKTDDGSEPLSDGLVEEIDAAKYDSIARRQAGLIPDDEPTTVTNISIEDLLSL